MGHAPYKIPITQDDWNVPEDIRKIIDLMPMMDIPKIALPDFDWSVGSFLLVNLNNAAKLVGPLPSGENPLLDPAKCEEFINTFHEARKVKASFGGYLEDRSYIWRGHYHKPGHFIHLGIDYNVPAGSRVCSVTSGEVVESWADPDQNGGWGGRVIIKPAFRTALVVYAHLDPSSLPPLGAILQGTLIGHVGPISTNGGWYPHLHVQCIRGIEIPADLDGYAAWSDDLRERFPDPIDVLT